VPDQYHSGGYFEYEDVDESTGNETWESAVICDVCGFVLDRTESYSVRSRTNFPLDASHFSLPRNGNCIQSATLRASEPN